MQKPPSTALTFYPAYCFPRSPTFNTWAKLTAANVHGLQRRDGFEGQNIYFRLNHPIKWVRLVGVIVAFDEWPNRWIFILDDSSGMNIEITCPRKPFVPMETPQSTDVPIVATKEDDRLPKNVSMGTTVTGNSIDMSGIDVGTIVKVKGGISDFRGERQITLERINIITSTTDEATAWTELSNFHRSILSKPWIISPAEELSLKEAADGTKRRAEEKLHRRRDREMRKEKKKRRDVKKKEKGEDKNARLISRMADKSEGRNQNHNIDTKMQDKPKDRRQQQRKSSKEVESSNHKYSSSFQLSTRAQRGCDVRAAADGALKKTDETSEQSIVTNDHSKRVSSSFLRKVALWTPTPQALRLSQDDGYDVEAEAEGE